MAVVTASDLGKDMAGKPLLRGVSFKLERRDRMTLSGRNGSGKTTLLRILAGQTGHDGGKLSLQKGAKVSLHDQRPPRERDLSLREYVLSGAEEAVALEAELARLEQAMADGDGSDKMLAAYSRTQERFDLRGGYRWRDEALATMHGLGFVRRRPGPAAVHLLRRRAHARVAGPRADRRARPAAAGRAHQPPGHRLAGVAGGPPERAGRRHRAGGPRPLVPGGRGHVGAGAGGGPLEVLPRHLDGVAQGAGHARDLAGQGDREAGGRDRAPGAVRRRASRPRPARRSRPSRGSSAWTRSRRSSATPRTPGR